MGARVRTRGAAAAAAARMDQTQAQQDIRALKAWWGILELLALLVAKDLLAGLEDQAVSPWPRMILASERAMEVAVEVGAAAGQEAKAVAGAAAAPAVEGVAGVDAPLHH